MPDDRKDMRVFAAERIPEPGADFDAMCGWLYDPHDEQGIHLADEADGWTFLTYREIAARVWRIAARLRAAQVAEDDRVCVVLPTDFDCVAAMYAVWACGATLTLVPPPSFGGGADYPSHLRGILDRAAPRVVVTSPDLAEIVGRAMAATEPLVLDATDTEKAPPLPRPVPAAQDCALVQFTSGSLGTPRGVRIGWRNLHANTTFITDAVGWRAGDSTVSWLPLYHDMGLIGGLLTTVAEQGGLWLMRPDQFVRDPGRWLRAMSAAQHTVAPSFGLGYTAKRLGREDVSGMDLSGLRSVITGAEPVDTADVEAFTELLADTGYDPARLRPAYGLAESTLMAAMSGDPVVARVDTSTLRFGHPVPITGTQTYRGQPLPGQGWILGLGGSTAESTVRVVDTDGTELPDGVLGEVAVAGPSVALGYRYAEGDEDRAPGEGTRFADGVLYSGDAGFLHEGQLYVLGRMGASIKVRGKPVFMEDVDARVAHETGLPKHRFAAVAAQGAAAGQGIVLFAEMPPGPWLDRAREVLRGDLGPARGLTIVTGGRGLIRRTSSGKPRRRLMWELLRSDDLGEGVVVHGESVRHDHAPAVLSDAQIRDLLARALEIVEVPAESTVLLEGSIAEGFGNSGSDIDFLVTVPGADETPEMPTVLFVGGRRVEVRTRSQRQLRTQLDYARGALSYDADAPELLDLNQDVLNRCQRFLHGIVVRAGAVEVEEIRETLPDNDFGAVMRTWWFARARQSLRQAVASAALGAQAESLGWARDGLLQALKGWAAGRGETYLESKWTGPQLDRIGDTEVTDRYVALDRALASGAEEGLLARTLDAVTTLGLPPVADDPKMVVLQRVPGVTSWPIEGRIHVLRGKRDVFVLSDSAARAWRSVVFGRSLAEITGGTTESVHEELAEFVRLGLVAVRWRGEGPIRPAVAMVKATGAYTCPPAATSTVLGVGGGTRARGRIVTLAPLPADRFAACASALIWANVIVENAREDLLGALEQRQGRVADVAADRLVRGVVRMVLCTLGCSPLPPDIAAVATLERCAPESFAGVIAAVRAAESLCFAELVAAQRQQDGLAVLDALVDAVRQVAELRFPASFDSHEQWRRTLAIAYDWLRMAAYLDTELPIDEVQDLLASGGAQPHQRHPDTEGETR